MNYDEIKSDVLAKVVLPIVGRTYRLKGQDKFKDAWVLMALDATGVCIFIRVQAWSRKRGVEHDMIKTWFASWDVAAARGEIRYADVR